MDYFVLKQIDYIPIPKINHSNSEEASVRIMEDISTLEKFDFLAAEPLVSDRMKLLLEQYLIEEPWRPCVFIESSKERQLPFWFLPPLPYMPQRTIFASNGTLQSIYVEAEDFARKSPGIFRIPNPGGTPFIVVHLSIAESILRRGICGLEFLRLSDSPEL